MHKKITRQIAKYYGHNLYLSKKNYNLVDIIDNKERY